MSDYNVGQTNAAQATRANAPQVGRTAAPPTANVTCFGTIENAASEIAGAASMVEALVDRMCGAEPKPDASKEQIRGLPSGVFDAAMVHAQQVNESARRIRGALQRLEHHLP